MNKRYKKIIKEQLEEYVKPSLVNLPDVKTKLIVDKDQTHFIVLDLGWQEDEFIHEWVFHIEIKDNEVWIHEDATDSNIAQRLIDAGVDQSHIHISFWQTPDQQMSNQDAA